MNKAMILNFVKPRTIPLWLLLMSQPLKSGKTPKVYSRITPTGTGL